MHALIQQAASQGRNLLEPEALELLADYGLSLPDHHWVKPGDEEGLDDLGLEGPMVLKTVSRDILHKSDVGGVRLGIADRSELAWAIASMRAELDAKVPDWRNEGWLVASQVPAGLELIAGMVRDPQFGPCLMLGLGGVWAEAMRDVCFRVLPVERADVEEMISGLKGQKLLNGFRGSEHLDRKLLADNLLGLARLCLENTSIVECDLNPVIWSAGRLTVADARIVLAAQGGKGDSNE